jgi:hypothetical protein
MKDEDAQTAASFLIAKHGSSALDVATARAQQLAHEGHAAEAETWTFVADAIRRALGKYAPAD